MVTLLAALLPGLKAQDASRGAVSSPPGRRHDICLFCFRFFNAIANIMKLWKAYNRRCIIYAQDVTSISVDVRETLSRPCVL